MTSCQFIKTMISIHASREGGDGGKGTAKKADFHFNPRLP